MSKDFIASPYQENIFQAVARGDRDIVVSAVAGSGKSTTLQHLLDYIPAYKTVLYCCFNADASKSLQTKINEYSAQKMQEGQEVPQATCSTIHSLGNSTLAMNGMRSQIKSNKYSTLVRQYLQEHMASYDSQLAQNVTKLIDMVRLTLAPTTQYGLMEVINRFDIDIIPEDKETWPVVVNAVREVLKAGIKQARDAKEIDFTDMIWLPSSQALNLTPKQYDWVLVDEAQDLNPAQRELVLKARRSTGRFIAVGDRSQAIYGFAGASLRSIDEIIEATHAIEMPLSICYRCPKSVVAKANEIYPGTESAPEAPEGIVESLETGKVSDMVQAGDLILCRLTAPLVSKCLELLRDGKRANVRGKDLGSQFTSLLNAMEKKYRQHMHIDTIVEVAHEYERWQIELLSINAEENEMKIASLQDKIDTLVALYEAYKARNNGSSSLDGFKQYIEAFFAEDKDAQIILSTGHRAKGLEYKRVFILNWDKLPHPKAKTAEQMIQEHNLMYVMVTRAQEALYLCMDYVPVPVEPEPLYSPFMAELFEEDEEEQPVTVPSVFIEELPEVEEIPVLAESLIVAEMPSSVPENVLEAPEVVETVNDTPAITEPSQSVVKPTLRKEHAGGVAKGKKPLKRDRVQQRLVVSPEIRACLKKDIENGIDVSDMIDQLLRQHYGLPQESSEPEKETSKITARLQPGDLAVSYMGGNIYQWSTWNGANLDEALEQIGQPDAILYSYLFSEEDTGYYRPKPPIEQLEEPTPFGQFTADMVNLPGYQYRFDLQEKPQRQEEPEVVNGGATPLVLEQESPDSKVIRRFYTCLSKYCKHHWTADYRIDKHDELYRFDETGKRITAYEDSCQCPKCGNKARYIKVDTLEATYSKVHKCDSRCLNATGPTCVCGCGGMNHGRNHMIGTPLLKEGNGQTKSLMEV